LAGSKRRDTDIETVITDLFDGQQYKNPVRVIAFNTSEGWSRRVSEDIARDLQQRCVDHMLKGPQGCRNSSSGTAAPAWKQKANSGAIPSSARSSRKCNQRPADAPISTSSGWVPPAKQRP